MTEGGKEAPRADDEVVAKSEILAVQEQVSGVQRVLGEKTLENEIQHEAVSVAHGNSGYHVCRFSRGDWR